ncbi:MAG TPA: toxin-antitoxin system TumE family protein [Candidatus Avalokitesvara rifleensis]|uniref:toxin-antitoxin system TumE family protein n=1 Tax=Candidatus Avalokitesvara rifleensis TaxID=3367620 RepID=UPI0027126907|nr:DUF6516 family protein [Candidatus Brocadiales bacterium]
MQIKDYLDEILNLIAENPFAVSQSLSFEERPPDSAFITGTVTFTDGSMLHLKEFVIFEPKGAIVLKYGYNYLAEDETLNFRYDNAFDPLVKSLSTYPEHKHTANGLVSAKRPAFRDVLSEISALMEVEK